jgi:transposase
MDLGGPGATWTIKKITTLIVLSALDKAEAGYSAVYGLVRKLGFRWKRGVKRLNRVDPVARAEFAEEAQRLVDEANRGERTLIYLDEAHIHCDLDEGYGWAWGGEPYEIPSSCPALSMKVSLYGAFVFNDPQVVLWKAPRCNTTFTLAYLFHLAKLLGDAPRPTIVWDGAPWHKPLYMLSIAEKVLGFEIVRLPAYSPDFMPVEALWRWLRDEVTRNQCHDSVDELVADVIEFGKRLNADPLGLITRLWPKLELREQERPEGEILPTASSQDPDQGGWVPPVPEFLQALQDPAQERGDQIEFIDDDTWERVRRVLPEPSATGRPPGDQRRVVDGILWIERTGAPWRQLPDVYGPRQTVHRYYSKWRASGIWEEVQRALNAAPQAPAVAPQTPADAA